jgi:hypothetical protein
LIPFGEGKTHVTSGALREEALLDAGLVGIGVPISHLIFREWPGEVREKIGFLPELGMNW